MSLNQYKGICFRCGDEVLPHKGDFQAAYTLGKTLRNKIAGKWLIRCFACKGLGNKPTETSPFYKLLNKITC